MTDDRTLSLMEDQLSREAQLQLGLMDRVYKVTRQVPYKTYVQSALSKMMRVSNAIEENEGFHSPTTINYAKLMVTQIENSGYKEEFSTELAALKKIFIKHNPNPSSCKAVRDKATFVAPKGFSTNAHTENALSMVVLGDLRGLVESEKTFSLAEREILEPKLQEFIHHFKTISNGGQHTETTLRNAKEMLDILSRHYTKAGDMGVLGNEFVELQASYAKVSKGNSLSK